MIKPLLFVRTFTLSFWTDSYKLRRVFIQYYKGNQTMNDPAPGENRKPSNASAKDAPDLENTIEPYRQLTMQNYPQYVRETI